MYYGDPSFKLIIMWNFIHGRELFNFHNLLIVSYIFSKLIQEFIDFLNCPTISHFADATQSFVIEMPGRRLWQKLRIFLVKSLSYEHDEQNGISLRSLGSFLFVFETNQKRAEAVALNRKPREIRH